MKKSGNAGFAAWVVLVVLGLAACDGTVSPSSEGDGLFSNGRLTITGINGGHYGSYQVYIHSSGTATSSYNNNSTASASVTFNSGTSELVLPRWSGSGSYYVYLADNSGLLAVSNSISFKNGTGTMSVNSFSAARGSLTITNIPAYLNGVLFSVSINNGGSGSASVASGSASFTLTWSNTGTGNYSTTLTYTDEGSPQQGSSTTAFTWGRGTVSFNSFQ